MSQRIVRVEYVDGYKLKLTFSNRKTKLVDLGNMLKKAKNMLLPLVDIDYFKKVECDGITICWPNGVDLCPDVLYRMGKEIRPSTRKKSQISRAIKPRKKSKSRT